MMPPETGFSQMLNTELEQLKRLGCIQCKLDPALFFYKPERKLGVLFGCHVDDFLHAGNERFQHQVRSRMRKYFVPGRTEEHNFRYIVWMLNKVLINYKCPKTLTWKALKDLSGLVKEIKVKV